MGLDFDNVSATDLVSYFQKEQQSLTSEYAPYI